MQRETLRPLRKLATDLISIARTYHAMRRSARIGTKVSGAFGGAVESSDEDAKLILATTLLHQAERRMLNVTKSAAKELLIRLVGGS